ncbi:hypothetical protein FDU21_14955 [Xanthomonas oryzae pv. oryzae]|nr:hypothetical protein FDU21_14955 [Xanthomonas oryzae pv. oryzae]
MTWATPFGSEVAQVRSPGPRHNRWCCDPELKPPGLHATVEYVSMVSICSANTNHCPSAYCHLADHSHRARCVHSTDKTALRRPCG